jgi:hypothetical protein
VFIRIKFKALNAQAAGLRDYSLRLLIVESYRKKGLPRQRIVKYLGSIRKKNLRTVADKHNFIEAMKKKVESMEELNFEQQTRIKLSLVRTIIHFH